MVQERTQFQLDKNIVKLIDEWIQETGYSRPKFLGSLIIDFVQQLQELRGRDDELFSQGLNEVKRGDDLRQFAQEEQISKWALQFYLQKYIPRALDYAVHSSGGPVTEKEG